MRDLLAGGTRALEIAGVASPRHDAAELLAHAAGVRRAELALLPEVDGVAAERFRAYVARRVRREPLQHILGTVAFRNVELAVGPGVFVPRPETEVVAGLAIAAAARAGDLPVVVDLCTGSGAVALAVANELPAAVVHAVEMDDAALAWAVRNGAARAAAGDTPVLFHHAAAAVALPELDGGVDVVVSNPPYVAESDVAALEPEVRDHDPRTALVAGPDGLAAVRDVLAAAARLLRPGGVVVVEHADHQGITSSALATAQGVWADVLDHTDLAGRPRVLTATRRG